MRGVPLSLGQEIVGGDEHGGKQPVEVGVRRGPFRSTMRMSTADFDLAATKILENPTNTATAVQSLDLVRELSLSSSPARRC